MKRTIIQLISGIMAVMLLALSCSHDEVNLLLEDKVPEGYVSVNFRVDQTDMREVESRSVDPDGQDIHDLKLFCFNAYGLFLSVVDASLTPEVNTDSGGHHTSGSYKAEIPEETSIIHFIANQNEAVYQGEDFVNKTEAQVLGAMEGGSGMMIYWRRFAKDATAGTDIKTQLEALALTGGIKLIRNQAKVTISNWDNQHHKVKGYVVTNIHAFGTVAPFCSTHGFAIYEWPVTDGHYSVTLPENKAMMSDITEVNTKSEDYIFEHENTLDNPVSVIIKDDKNMYYRAMIMDDDGNMLPILRNHHYVITIEGPMSYGQDSFEKALNAPATNNVWVSVDSWVKEVADTDYILTLAETSKVFHESEEKKAYSFEYTLTNADGTLTGITAPEVSWLEGNNVGRHDFVHHFDPTTGKGYISVTLLEDNPNTPEQTGTLMIRKGRLFRTIDISMISTQKFTPSWIAAQVYGDEVGEKVTLKFTIPETCPESLFPFPVMITSNNLDIRAGSGMTLPVRLENEVSYYGEPNNSGYKYEYMVNGPGIHRVYFHSILTHGHNETDSVVIEANYFEKLKKEVVFVNHTKSIRLPDDMPVYNGDLEDTGFSRDELVKYCLVPQKVNASVKFDMYLIDMGTRKDDTSDDIYLKSEENDEFLLYSRYLNYYTGNGATINGENITFDCEFGGVSENIWEQSTNGRVAAFRPKTRVAEGEGGQDDTQTMYSVYMYTNRPVSQDVIRIASNAENSKAYWNGDAVNNDDNVKYEGETYRSVIFELSNYRPFRFAAQVNGEGSYKNSHETDEEEVVETVTWDYAAPGKSVDISFDVTSFQSKTDDSSVDPFGTAFEIYIDAPMLEIDESRLGTCKLNETKLKKVDGRFVYTVDASRETERAFGTDGVKNVDNATGANQNGERKTLPFKTKKVTSSGEIKISSNKDQVVYYDKTFKVKNNLITGSIKYDADNDGVAKEPVPANAFVAFVRKLTNSRIGSVTINTAGQYSLNLRSEYTFNWTDEIEFDCKIGGVAYEYKVVTDENEEEKPLTLEYLSTHPDVTLTVATSVQSE